MKSADLETPLILEVESRQAKALLITHTHTLTHTLPLGPPSVHVSGHGTHLKWHFCFLERSQPPSSWEQLLWYQELYTLCFILIAFIGSAYWILSSTTTMFSHFDPAWIHIIEPSLPSYAYQNIKTGRRTRIMQKDTRKLLAITNVIATVISK